MMAVLHVRNIPEIIYKQAQVIAEERGMTLTALFYDAFYPALAQRLNLPLVTADMRLIAATQGKGFDVRDIAGVFE